MEAQIVVVEKQLLKPIAMEIVRVLEMDLAQELEMVLALEAAAEMALVVAGIPEVRMEKKILLHQTLESRYLFREDKLEVMKI